MSRARTLWLAFLALASGGLAVFIAGDALLHEAFSRSIAYAVMPLILIFAVSWTRLRDARGPRG